MWSAILVSLFLLLSAGGLMAAHRRTWLRAQQRELEPGEFDYYRRQYRRRMQTSAMLGLLAAAILAGKWMTRPTTWTFVYWGCVLSVVGWVGLLAMADMVSTKHHFSRLRRQHFMEQAKLHAEIRRMQPSGGNEKDPRPEEG